MIGICSRDCSAAFWSSFMLATPPMSSTEPTCPLRASLRSTSPAVPLAPVGPDISSWPNFSATVLLFNTALTSALTAGWGELTPAPRAGREEVRDPVNSTTTAATNAAKIAPDPMRRLGLAQTTRATRSAISPAPAGRSAERVTHVPIVSHQPIGAAADPIWRRHGVGVVLELGQHVVQGCAGPHRRRGQLGIRAVVAADVHRRALHGVQLVHDRRLGGGQ